MGYGVEFDGTTVSLGGDYIGNTADPDDLTSALSSSKAALVDYVSGCELHGSISIAPVTVNGGNMSAADSFKLGEVAFNDQGARPTAWNAEVAFTTDVMGKKLSLPLQFKAQKKL